MANIADGNAFVAGRDVERVRRLLAISEEIGSDPRLVLTRNGGYEVPAAVADAYEAEQSKSTKTSAKSTSSAKGRTTKKASEQSDTNE